MVYRRVFQCILLGGACLTSLSAFAYVDLQAKGRYANVTSAWQVADVVTKLSRGESVVAPSYPIRPSLTFEQPTWFRPHSLTTAPTDASYWINLLPYEKHRYANMYLVIPTAGSVMPVMEIPPGTDDYEKLKWGRDIEINKYLINGVLLFPQSGMPGQVGNMFVFGHSNGVATWPGEFNTVMANVMGLEVDKDQIWVYYKIGTEFKLYKYDIVASYDTSPSNVSVMQWDGAGADITLSACTNILAGRWIVKATLVDEYAILGKSLQARIRAAVKKIGRLPRVLKKYAVLFFFDKLETTKETLSPSESKYLLKSKVIEFVIEELAVIYPLS